jgi:predicted TIM-barrel fold metal-dependent hydrolase
MLIVDAQIHLWEKGTPSAHHRQEPYSAEQAIAGMDAAGVDRALIHPVLWDPDSNELAVEAVRNTPSVLRSRAGSISNDPNGRDLVAHWKEGRACSACAFIRTSGTRNPGSRRHPRLAVARRGARASAGGARRGDVSANGRAGSPSVTRRQLIIDHLGVPRASKGEAASRLQPELLALARYPNVAVKATGQAGYAEDEYPFRSLHPHLQRCFDAFGPARMFWGTDITRMPCSWCNA